MALKIGTVTITRLLYQSVQVVRHFVLYGLLPYQVLHSPTVEAMQQAITDILGPG